MDIKEVLAQINIGGKKADIYLSCLESGGATAYSIAKKVGLKRPTVYDVLDQLLKEGLVYKSIKHGAKHYFPANPERILKKIKDSEENVKMILPILQNLYNSPKTKPLIKYFEGAKGIEELYEDSLRDCKKGDEILAYVGEDCVKYLPVYSAQYVKNRVAKGIRIRGIYKKYPDLMKYVAKSNEQLRIAKVLDGKDFPVHNEINIYGSKVAIINYGKEMFGMIIESEELARSQKAIFELAWHGADAMREL